MIGPYDSQYKNFEYGYPHSNAFLQSCHKLECGKPHRDALHLMKYDVTKSVVALEKQVH